MPEWGQPQLPIDELVSTILSQNTNDRNRDLAFSRLRARFATWEQVRDAPVQDVIEAIRPAGLANQKGPRIQQVLAPDQRRARLAGFEFPARPARRRRPGLADALQRRRPQNRLDRAGILAGQAGLPGGHAHLPRQRADWPAPREDHRRAGARLPGGRLSPRAVRAGAPQPDPTSAAASATRANQTARTARSRTCANTIAIFRDINKNGNSSASHR